MVTLAGYFYRSTEVPSEVPKIFLAASFNVAIDWLVKSRDMGCFLENCGYEEGDWLKKTAKTGLFLTG